MAASSQKKKCAGKWGCAKELPLTDFYKNQRICKKCSKKRDTARYKDPDNRKRILDQKKTAEAAEKRRKSNNARNYTEYGAQLRIVKCCLKRFKRGSNSMATQELFGCTADDFKAHIISHFEPWMDWDENYAGNTGEYNKTWNFDHTVPYKAFKESFEKDKKIVCWYKNIRPMCAKKNNEKSRSCMAQDKQALIDKYNLEHGEN